MKIQLFMFALIFLGTEKEAYPLYEVLIALVRYRAERTMAG